MALQNVVNYNGLGAVTAEQLNAFTQNVPTVDALRTFTGLTGMGVMLAGTSALNDGGQGFFVYVSSSTAADDNGVTAVVPTGNIIGAWLRLNLTPSIFLNLPTTLPAEPGLLWNNGGVVSVS